MNILFSLFLIVGLSLVVGAYHLKGNVHDAEAYSCAIDAKETSMEYYRLLHWKEEGRCCAYANINNSIGAACG
jgi:hypothetical protein